jgi:cytochrome b6
MVPVHRFDFVYFTGGVILFLFILQFITGITLAFYYVPHPEHAHKSIIDIVTKLNMGWFFRSFHHWGAQLLMVFLFLHLFATLLTKAYRKPRELVWVTGFILLGVSIFFGLSGYLLIWDERALAAVKVATGGAGAYPIIGDFLKAFLRGGIDVTGDTLIRFYAFHVSLLPLVSLGLIGLHVLMVQYHGMSVPPAIEKKGHGWEPFFPNVFLKDLAIWSVVLGVVVTFAVFLPPQIGPKADILAPTPENIKPEWYFLFLFQTLKLFPGEVFGLSGETVAVVVVSVGITFFFLLPFLDRKASRGEASPFYTKVAIAYVVFFVVMTVIGFLS